MAPSGKPVLPPPCPDCEPYGGSWRQRADQSGMERCGCARGRTLQAADKRRSEPPPPYAPKIPDAACLELANALAAMDPRSYPRESQARAAIASEIQHLCHSPEEARWLLGRMFKLYRRWPGISELRTVYCASGHIPVDGDIQVVGSEIYPEGIPPEFPVPADRLITLPLGHVVSADPMLEAYVNVLAEAATMPAPKAEDFRPKPRFGERLIEARAVREHNSRADSKTESRAREELFSEEL